MRQTSHFKHGSGCFNCENCGRSTRDTGDNGDLKLCPECYEVAGLENYVSDHANDGDNDAELQRSKSEIIRLSELCKSKGGKL